MMRAATQALHPLLLSPVSADWILQVLDEDEGQGSVGCPSGPTTHLETSVRTPQNQVAHFHPAADAARL